MEKIKHFLLSEQGKDILTVLIVIFASTASFELGRLSKSEQNSAFKVDYADQSANALEGLKRAYTGVINDTKAQISTDEASVTNQVDSVSTEKNFFASKRGHNYYSVGCSGGKTLSEANKIWFSTGEEAEKAGYKLSKSCS